MTHTAILFREIRAANHAMDLLRLRQVGTRFAVGIIAFLLMLEAFEVPALRNAGFYLFVILVVALILGASNGCIGMLANERQEGTLDLLFLAGIKPWELFLGKLLGAGVVGASTVMGCVPLLGLPFLSGGLSFETFVGMLALLAATLLAVVGVSLLVSTLARRASDAWIGLVILGAGWLLALPVVHWMGRLVTGVPPFGEGWLSISPLHTTLLLESGLAAANRIAFWRGVTVLLLAGLGSMIVSSILLRFVWKWDLDRAYSSTPFKHAATRGVPLPDQVSPIEAALAQNRRHLRLHGWILWLAAGLWLLGGIAWGRPWLSPVVALCITLLLATLTEAVTSLPLIQNVTELRRSGGMEMMLITPLTDEAIVDGFARGAKRLTAPWKRKMALLASVILAAGFPMYHWNVPAVATYLLAGGLLVGWIAANPVSRFYAPFRIAMFTGDMRMAQLQLGGVILRVATGQLWGGFQLFQYLRKMGRLPKFPTGELLELCITFFGVLTIAALNVAFREQRNLIRVLAIDELRFLATQPLPARTDPRLKKWQATKPVPEF